MTSDGQKNLNQLIFSFLEFLKNYWSHFWKNVFGMDGIGKIHDLATLLRFYLLNRHVKTNKLIQLQSCKFTLLFPILIEELVWGLWSTSPVQLINSKSNLVLFLWYSALKEFCYQNASTTTYHVALHDCETMVLWHCSTAPLSSNWSQPPAICITLLWCSSFDGRMSRVIL